jgi:hypothetical protein
MPSVVQHVLTRLLPYWNMNAQVINDAYIGSAYGVRKIHGWHGRGTRRVSLAQPNSQKGRPRSR